MIGTPPAQGASAAFCARVPSPSAGRGLASVVSIPSERRVTGTEWKGSFRRPLSYRLYPQDVGLTTAPVLPRALDAAGGFGVGRGGGGVAGGGALVGGGGYFRDCVGGARTVCAALSPTLRGFSSGLTGSDDAASLSYPRATRACGLVAMDGRSVDGGASSVGGGPTGNRVGSRSDLVRTPQHLLYAGAASLTRRPMRAVLVELGRVVRPLFYCPGLKGSTSTALLVSPPSSETCGGSMAAAAGARGGGVGGVAGGGSLVGVTRVSGPAALAAAAGGGLSGIGGTGCVTGRSHGA